MKIEPDDVSDTERLSVDRAHDDNVSGAMIITIFCIGTLLASIVGGFMSFRRPQASKISEYEEKLALALAQQKGGILSVAELALKTSMDVARSRDLLDHFVNTHVAEPDVTEDGEIVYRFPAFSRESTRSVMEFEFSEEDYEFGEEVEAFEKHEQGH